MLGLGVNQRPAVVNPARKPGREIPMNKPTAKPAAKPVTKAVTKPAAGQDINKSEEIRKIATAMKAEGKKPRPVLIIADLKKHGIVVSSPQVSMVLKKMGFRPRKRRSPAQEAAQKPVGRVGGVSVEDLIAARKVVTKFGGADRAIAAINAFRQITGR